MQLVGIRNGCRERERLHYCVLELQDSWKTSMTPHVSSAGNAPPSRSGLLAHGCVALPGDPAQII